MPEVLCPICGIPLTATSPNPNIYSCSRRKVWVSDLGIHLDIVHASMYLTPEGKATWQVIEIPPYSFHIQNEGENQKTEVRKVIPQKKNPWDNTKAKTFERKIILSINAAVDMPWHDKDRVVEKLKTYLLFS